MKIGIIGLGNVARYQIDALNRIDNISLTGVYDINPEITGLIPGDTTLYTSLDSMLEQCDADLFLVSTPNVTHYEIGIQVLQHNRPLLLEKPCCETIQQLQDLVALSQRQQHFFAAAFHASYARDLKWFLEEMNCGHFDPGPLTGFHLCFFDPYYIDGHLNPMAHSLGGSWFDSGINALSVIGRLIEPDRIKLVDGYMTHIESIPCSEIQGSANFSFSDKDNEGYGIIETNWTLGLNRKTTKLFYLSSNTQVILHHSDETVYIYRDGKLLKQKNLQNGLPRLTNHYINLFTDITDRLNEKRDNLDYATVLHKLLFAAGAAS